MRLGAVAGHVQQRDQAAIVQRPDHGRVPSDPFAGQRADQLERLIFQDVSSAISAL